VERQQDDLQKVLREAGMRVTPQRLAVIELMRASKSSSQPRDGLQDA
jgi:Fe2+ or Zn2+ uptake regulation protein